MKALIFFVCLGIVPASFAAETETECAMMREAGDRTNPKATLEPRPAAPRTPTATAQ
jgi:hypothetical protein